jgi:hypothetical protein
VSGAAAAGGAVGTAAAARQAERLSTESRARRTDTKVPSSRAGRSPARATILILGGVIAVVVVAAVLILSSGGGGKSSVQGSTAGQGSGQSTAGARHHTHSTQTSPNHGESSATAASPASTTVAVLNGTSINGLAHSLSKDLQQSGYAQASALDGTPPGSHPTTIIEYSSGHHAEAQGVASALSVTQVQPMETAISSLAGAATVVVIAGEDKASAVGETPGTGGGGASSATGQ